MAVVGTEEKTFKLITVSQGTAAEVACALNADIESSTLSSLQISVNHCEVL
jgi:hypothetical protein